MTAKKVIASLVLFCVLCALFALFVESANAQADDLREEYLGGPSSARETGEEAEGPTKLKMTVGVGSIFVMIAGVKWL